MKNIIVLAGAAIAGLALGGASGIFTTRPATEQHSDSGSHTDPGPEHESEAHNTGGHDAHGSSDGPSYYTLPNQLIVPIVSGSRMTSMVILSIGLETTEADRITVAHLEPKLRSALMSVLFDLSSAGALNGNYTARAWRDRVQASLLETAQAIAGDMVSDAFILEVNRQDL